MKIVKCYTAAGVAMRTDFQGTQAEVSNMKCAICGKDLPEGSSICSNCGTRQVSGDAAWAFPARPAGDGNLAAGIPALDIHQDGEPLPGEFRASQPAQDRAPGESAHGDPAGAEPRNRSTRHAAPRRRHTALVVVVVLLAVLVGGGFIGYQVFGRDIRRRIMGPKKSYLMIEGLVMKDSMDRLAGGIADSVKQDDQPVGIDTSMSVKLATPIPGINADLLRTINSLKIQTRTMLDREATGPKFYTRSDLYTGSEQLLGVEAFAAENQLTLGLPGLIQQYIAFPVSSAANQPGQSGPISPLYTQSLMAFLKQSLERAPLIDKVELAASLNKVANVFLANIDSAEFTDNVPVTAGGVTVPYECYIMKSNGRQLRDMAVGTLELVRDEKPLSDLLYPYFRDRSVAAMNPLAQLASLYSGYAAPSANRKPMTESEWKAMLTETIDRLKAAKDADLQDLAFTQRVYVDKQDKIHGRELNIVKLSTQQMADFKILAPVKDGKHGLMAALAVDDKDDSSVNASNPSRPFDVQFTTNYEEKDGLKTGSADILFDGRTPLTATYRGLGMQAAGSLRYLVGEIDLNVDARSLDSSMPIPKISLKSSVNGGHHVMEISAAGLVSLTIDQTRLPASDVKIPSLSGKTMVQANDQAALNRLMTLDVQMKLMAILQKLKLDPSMFF